MQLTTLFDAISLKHAKQYRKAWDPSKYEKLFNSFSDHDKNAFRIYFPLGQISASTIKIPVDIISHLNSKGYEIDNYLTGLAKQKADPTRKIKIGKLLNDNPILKIKFDSDTQRTAAKKQDLWVVISRHPVDIAGMSTDRGWTSCMNLTNGQERKYVMSDVKGGTLIAYVIEKDDRNIQHPLSRILIKPFIEETTNDLILYPEDKVYGSEVRGFHDFIINWCNKVNKGKSAGLYCLPDNMYPDTRKYVAFAINDMSEEERIKAVASDPTVLKYIENPSEKVQMVAVQNEPTMIQYIENPSEKVQVTAVTEDITSIRFIKNPSERAQVTAVTRNWRLIQLIKNPTPKVKTLAQNLKDKKNIKSLNLIEYRLNSRQDRWYLDNKATIIVSMPPKLFIELTTEKHNLSQIQTRKKSKEFYQDLMDREEITIPPFLSIKDNGQIVSHEGRARALAAIDAGDTEFQVGILLFPSTRNASLKDIPEIWIGQFNKKVRFSFGSGNVNSIYGVVKVINPNVQKQYQTIEYIHNENINEYGTGLVIPGVNTTKDIKPDHIKTMAAKFRFEVDINGHPPLLTNQRSILKALFKNK